ncbi:MAG: rhomboid family intramembrane serine protease [Filimonas sp.]|nr:rhomboid family intramembrane serine protease [Filimonas sp.]
MITITIIVITCLVSFLAFSNEKLKEDLIFYPPAISKHKQWYRFVTCGFIHADIGHLVFNMFSLYVIGRHVEERFIEIFDTQGKILYIALYLTALVACLIPTYNKNKDNYYYRSLGASGAVSAVVFAFMFFYPTMGIGMMFIPVYIPGFIFGPIYLIISSILDKRGGGNINHSAHIWGAIYGVIFVIITCYFLSSYRPVTEFVEMVKAYISAHFS